MSPIFLQGYNTVSHETCFPLGDSHIVRIIRNSVKSMFEANVGPITVVKGLRHKVVNIAY